MISFGSHFWSSFQIVQSIKVFMFASSTVLPIDTSHDTDGDQMIIIGLLAQLALMLSLMKMLNVA